MSGSPFVSIPEPACSWAATERQIPMRASTATLLPPCRGSAIRARPAAKPAQYTLDCNDLRHHGQRAVAIGGVGSVSARTTTDSRSQPAPETINGSCRHCWGNSRRASGRSRFRLPLVIRKGRRFESRNCRAVQSAKSSQIAPILARIETLTGFPRSAAWVNLRRGPFELRRTECAWVAKDRNLFGPSPSGAA